MRIAGTWVPFEDGITRPLVTVYLQTVNGTQFEEQFLVDCGADQTVFTAELFVRLGLAASPGSNLAGVGGTHNSVSIQTTLVLKNDAGGTAVIRGEFAAFTSPSALDLNVLGRDVLNNFDVILSRPRNEILLLSPPHRYFVHTN
jgi:hypothetical protein